MNVGGAMHQTPIGRLLKSLQLAIDWLYFGGQYQDALTQISGVVFTECRITKS